MKCTKKSNHCFVKVVSKKKKRMQSLNQQIIIEAYLRTVLYLIVKIAQANSDKVKDYKLNLGKFSKQSIRLINSTERYKINFISCILVFSIIFDVAANF